MRTPAFLPPERAEASCKGHFAAGAPMTTELREVLRCRTVLAWPIHAGNPLDRLRFRAALGPATTGTTTLRLDRHFRALPSRADARRRMQRFALAAAVALELHLAFNTAGPELVSHCGA